MKKRKVVVFTKNNARILTNPLAIKVLERWENAVVDPDLSEMRGVPLEFWKLEDGKIVEMTRPEKLVRIAHHTFYGIDNTLSPSALRPRKTWLYVVVGLGVATAGAALAWHLGLLG
jgi:hypothetical protein